jgi:hypothetical protein
VGAAGPLIQSRHLGNWEGAFAWRRLKAVLPTLATRGFGITSVGHYERCRREPSMLRSRTCSEVSP